MKEYIVQAIEQENIESFDAHNAPELVRCISCTFYRSDGECALHNGRWKPEGFCSWAIRKESGEVNEID